MKVTSIGDAVVFRNGAYGVELLLSVEVKPRVSNCPF